MSLAERIREAAAAFDLALEGDSGDAEIESAIELRDLALEAADELEANGPGYRDPRRAVFADQYSDDGQCARCRHAEHEGLPCLNAQSDNDCACPPDSREGG